MATEDLDHLPRCRVPDARGLVGRGRDNKRAIRREHGAIDRAVMAKDRPYARMRGAPDQDIFVRVYPCRRRALHRWKGQSSAESDDEGPDHMQTEIGEAANATETAEAIYQDILGVALNGRSVECEASLLRLARHHESLDRLLLLFDRLRRKLDATPQLAGWSACAIYAEGLALFLAGQIEKALDRFELVIAKHQGDGDSVLQRAVARAMYARVEALQRLGNEAAKTNAIDKLITCFSQSPDPIIQNQAIRPLICDSDRQIRINAPAGHALQDRYLLSLSGAPEVRGFGSFIDGVLNKMVRKLFQKRAAEVNRANAQRLAEEVRNIHNEAMKVLERHRQTGEPFALFLRSFDVEVHRATIKGPGGVRILHLESLSPDVEAKLIRVLEGRMPLIGVSNPYSTFRSNDKRCLKIEVLHETWRATVLELIERACLVVFQVTDLSIGVIFEVEALYSWRRQDATVLVRSQSKGYPREFTASSDDAPFLATGSPVEPTPPSAVVNRVKSFPYQIDEADFIRDGVILPVFAELLERAAFVQSLTSEDRRDPARCEDLYLAHLRSQPEHSPDRARMYERALAYRNAGSTIRAHGQPAAALGSYLAALALVQGLCEAEPQSVRWLEDLSVLHEHIGDLLRSEGRLDEAVGHYSAGMETSKRLAALDKQSSGPQGELVCLGRIGDVMIETRNLEGAIEAWQAVRILAETLVTEHPDDSKWQHYLSGANSRMGDLEALGGRCEDAIGYYRISQTILERLTAADSANLGWQQDLAFTHKKLGLCLSETKRFAEAISEFEKSRDRIAFIATHALPKLWEAELDTLSRKISETESAMM